MGYVKQYIEKGIRRIFPVLIFLNLISLAAIWCVKIAWIRIFLEKLFLLEGTVGVFIHWVAAVQTANQRFLFVETAVVFAGIFMTRQVSTIWNFFWKVLSKIQIPFFEHKPVTNIRYTFLEKLNKDSGKDYTSDVYYVSDKYESDDIREDHGTNGEKFAGEFKISIHDNQVEAGIENNAEPVIVTNKFKHFETAKGITYFRKLSNTFAEPKDSNRRFTLKTQKAFCKKQDNTWTTVEVEDQLWEGNVGNDIEYFRLIDEFGIWKAECYSTRKISVEKTKVIQENKETHYPKELELTVKKTETGDIMIVNLHYTERYYRPDYDNGEHLSRIEPDSDCYPYIIAGCFGPVSTGKSSWIAALTSNTAKNRMKQLMRVYYNGQKIEAKDVRTMIRDQNVIALSIRDKRKRIGTIYLLDLAGEMTVERPERNHECKKIIESIGKIADAIIEFSDDRVFYEDEYEGDNGYIYDVLDKANEKGLAGYTFLLVSCKGDILKERIKTNPKLVHHQESGNDIPIATPDNQVFMSVADVAKTSVMGADELMYQHMSLAKEILKKAGIVVDYENDKCFIVSAGTSMTYADGKKGVNCENEVNCELPLAYLIQMKFGISLKQGMEE